VARAGPVPDLITTRALGRALLARQLLLERVDRTPLAVIAHLVGLQAQAPSPPYIGLWCRLARFQVNDLGRLLVARRVVRIALMRSTIHLVSARDCLAIRPLVQPVIERAFRGSRANALTGVDLQELVAAGRELVEARPRAFRELGEILKTRWPETDPESLAQAIRTYVPLVQVPPRGLWGVSGAAIHTSAESWLGEAQPRPLSLETLVRRYLAAFGPATVQDMQAWSGLTRLADVVSRMRPRLREFRGEHGQTLFDLADAPRPHPDVPAPVRLLAEWDNVLLAHADRSRVVTDQDRKRLFSSNGMIPGAVLLDGVVRGVWKLHRGRRTSLRIVPYARLTRAARHAITEEGMRLLAFVAPDRTPHDVQYESGR
jgi:hypothetical protein